MKDLVIIGAGNVGTHIAHNYAQYGLNYKLIGFLDDDPSKQGLEIAGHKVIGTVDRVFELGDVAVVIGIAFPRQKRQVYEKLAAKASFEYPSLISAKAWVSEGVKIGRGSIVYPGASVNYGSEVGDFSVVNMNCALGHNTTMDAYVALAPGVNLAGFTHVEEGADVGIGAATRQRVRIGKYAVVGGQSMLLDDVPAHSTVAGVPARLLADRD